MTSIRFAAGASVVELALPDDELGQLVQQVFADLATDAEPTTVGHLAVADDGVELKIGERVVQRTPDPAVAVDYLVSWANYEVVGSRVACVNIHASALCPPGTDTAIVVPASSASGKSTLAMGLLNRGWQYLSDEVVSLDVATGRVLAYPKPLTFKPGTRAMVDLDEGRTLSPRQQRWYVRASELGGSVIDHARPTALLFTRYEDHAPTERTPLTVTEATLELAVNCQDQLGSDGSKLFALAQLATATTAERLVHSSLSNACDAAEALVRRATDLRPAPKLVPLTAGLPAGGPIWLDSIVTVALCDGWLLHDPDTQRLAALDPVAGAIWELLDGSATQTELVAELSATYSAEPATVATDVAVLLDRLRDEGFLTPG